MRGNFVIDPIIFSLQRFGGISRLWRILIPQLSSISKAYSMLATSTSEQLDYNALPTSAQEGFCLVDSFSPRFQKLFPPKLTVAKAYLPTYYRPGPRGIPTLQVCHDTMREEAIPNRIVRKAVTERRAKIYQQASSIVCVSAATLSSLDALYGAAISNKATVIHNPVPAAPPRSRHEPSSRVQPLPAHFPHHTPYAVYVGKRDGMKNFRDASTLLKSVQDLRLVVIGSSFLESELQWISAFGPRVIHLGACADEVVTEILLGASFLFLPSNGEGFGYPGVEAASLGIPTVCKDIQVNREILDIAGLYYDDGSSDSLADAATRAIEGRCPSKHAIRSVLARYDPKMIALRYHEVVSSL
jgi:glycosyltransferase involved in cell wall biosynthesis